MIRLAGVWRARIQATIRHHLPLRSNGTVAHVAEVGRRRKRRLVLIASAIVLLSLATGGALVIDSASTGIHLAVDDAGLIDDFSDDPNGFKTETDSGLPVHLFPLNSPRTPRVSSGTLSFDAEQGSLGGYYIVKMPGVRNASVDFSFTPWSAGGGLVCLAFMESNIALTSPVVPRSPMHFTLSPTAWSVDVFDTVGATARTIVEGNFETPLLADGVTVHTLGIRLDPGNGAAEITLPTGDVVTATDPSFAIPADFAYVESWRTEEDTDETLAMVHAWAADSEITYKAPK